MAIKHDWIQIRRDYEKDVIKNNVPLKAFSEEHHVPYSYMRKQAAQWQQDKQIAHTELLSVIEEETRSSDTVSITDRNMFHINAYDKALMICLEILNNPLKHLCTEDGTYKPANLERVINTIEKCQKGQRLALGLDSGVKDTKNLLGDITAAIKEAKKTYSDIQGDDE